MYLKCRFLSVVIVLVLQLCAESKKPSVISTAEQKSRWAEPIDGGSWFWRSYEFDTGVGNREELAVTNVLQWQDASLKENVNNWQYVKRENENFLVEHDNLTLHIYNFDAATNRVSHRASVYLFERIKSFKAISLFDNTGIISERNSINVVVYVESDKGDRYLKWFYLLENSFIRYWIEGLHRPVRDIEFFSLNNKHKLLLLYEPDTYFNGIFSLFDIYDIQLEGNQSESRLCYSHFVPETSQIQVCSSREDKTTVSLLGENYLALYEYSDESIQKCIFKETQRVMINGVINNVCFESGNIHYLATSGLAANLFYIRDDQFMYAEKMQQLFQEIGSVEYVQSLPVDTYRDEAILLLQLKNKTILGFSWQGTQFELMSSMPNELHHFDLTAVTIIPNFGLISGNTFVKFDVQLIELPRPDESKIERMYRKKLELETILEGQESAIAQAASLIEKSYLNNLETQSNGTEIEIDNLVVNGSNDFLINLGSKSFTFSELQSDFQRSVESLSRLESRVSEIEDKLKYTRNKNLTDIDLNNIEIIGDFEVKGSLTVENLKVDYLNGIPMAKSDEEYLSSGSAKITGTKSFPTIEIAGNNLKIKNINGIPLDQIVFDEVDRNYTGIDFSKITKLRVENDLNFTKILGVDWKNLVFKDRNAVIPGTTAIEGEINTVYMGMKYLNGNKYNDYVLKSLPISAILTGNKSIDVLTVTDLEGVKTINGIDADEFVILTADQNLTEEITFENLVIQESLQIDGNVVGPNGQDFDPDLTLLNSNVVQSNLMITNLYVTGNVYVENVINSSTWSDLNDLILDDDDNVTVTGTKTFLNNVHIKSGLEIKSRIINGHSVSDFFTLDTRQVLPNLTNISGNVTFDEVSYEELKNFEDRINANVDYKGSQMCMNKPLVFEEAPILDEFSASYINENITGAEFSQKLETLLENVRFDNLKVKKLIVENLDATVVNGVNVEEIKRRGISKSGYQEITGNITIDYLEVDKLFVNFVNGKSPDELERMINLTSAIYDNVFEGNLEVDSLNVTEYIVASRINGKDLNEVLGTDSIETFVFRSNETIENIVVEGLVNGLNFSKKVSDLVLKNEDNIVIKGLKKFKKLTTNNLHVDFINGYSSEDIVCVDKQQVLTGPIIVQGSVKVNENFTSTGNINEVPFNKVSGNIHKIDNESYLLVGDFVVEDDVFIKNLTVFGKVQNVDIVHFMRNLIYTDEENVEVKGAKIFTSVKFDGNVTVLESLDDLNLEKFYRSAILIDRPIYIKSKITFEDDILIKRDLIVRNNFKTYTIKNVNINDLMDNAAYVNRPTYIADSVTLSNVIFNSDIIVDSWNGIKMDSLFTLHKDQTIKGLLMLADASADKLEINGLINGENLTEIYENTFKLSTDQRITGGISFMNTVNVVGDFNSRYINEIDMTQVISLDDTDPIIGNFIFDNSLTVKANLTVNQYLSGLNITEWHANAVKMYSPDIQVMFGNWTIHGNVHFKQNILGSGSINGIDVRKLAYDIKTQQVESNALIANIMEGLKDLCKELQRVQQNVENMVYNFRSIEFFKVFQFDQRLISFHHFEFKNVDYIMVNFETCHLDVFAFDTKNFKFATNASNFGYVKQYLTFSFEDKMFFLTVGKSECGRSSGNLWELDNDQFKLVLDLGDVTDAEKLGEDAFAVVVDREVQEWSLQKIIDGVEKPVNILPVKERNAQFFSNENDTLLASRDTIYELPAGNLEFDEYENPFTTNDILTFRVGVDRKEHILYSKSQKNSDYLYICTNELSQPKILQTISAHKPSSFLVVNFDGFQENLLIFLENKRTIQIYQYRGIEGFKHHSSIKMKADKLFSFKLRTHLHFVKKNLMAVLYDDKLSILELRTYGEKLYVPGNLDCDKI